MSTPLIEAKLILASNKSDKAAREFMTIEHRTVLAEDYPANKQFLSASHFTPDTEMREEFERLLWDNIKPKGN